MHESQCYPMSVITSSVLWHCWLGKLMGIWPVRIQL